MSKAGKKLIAAANEVLDLVRSAHKLYEADGNSLHTWHAEDEITRLYYLRLASQNEEMTTPA